MTEFRTAYLAAKMTEQRKVALYLDYVDINEGYLHDAVLFSQIMYWHIPSKKNNLSKMRVFYEDVYWVAKHHDAWYEECRIKAPMVRKALKRMQERNLIHYDVTGFAGKKTPLVRINWEGFQKAITAQYDTLYQSNMTQCIKPNTDITSTETTKEKDSQQQNAAAQSASDLDSGHEAIALEIRAANDAMRGDDHEIFHDCIEDYIDTDETTATVKFDVNELPVHEENFTVACDDFAALCLYGPISSSKGSVAYDLFRFGYLCETGYKPVSSKSKLQYKFKLSENGLKWCKHWLSDDAPDSTLKNIVLYTDYSRDVYPGGEFGNCDNCKLENVLVKGGKCFNCHSGFTDRTVAKNDDSFLGTRDDPVTPDGADWPRDAVGSSNAGAMQVQPLTDKSKLGLSGIEVCIPHFKGHECQCGCDGTLGEYHIQLSDNRRVLYECFKRGVPEVKTPATSTGAIVPALEAQQNTTPTKKPKSLKTAKAKKPGKSPEQKQIDANMWEAVKFVWKLTDNAAWKITKFRKFFLGTVKNSKADKRYGEDWKNCQLDEYPATPHEVVAFGHWYRNTYDDITLPEKGQTLLNHFEGFRGHEDYNAFIRKAANTILDKLPKFSSPGIELEREQNKPVDEAEIVVITPEQKAEIQAMYDIIGKGGN